MDEVFIEGLSFAGMHGVMEHERKVEQEFVFDIRASFDARKAAASDKLSDTVNYVTFREIVREVISQKPKYLIEHVAEIVAQRILEDARIAEVSITIRKPAVIVGGVPGITIRRRQS